MFDTDLLVGDVVRLKSGGPTLTVAAIKDEFVAVVWFNKNDEQMSAMLHINTIYRPSSPTRRINTAPQFAADVVPMKE